MTKPEPLDTVALLKDMKGKIERLERRAPRRGGMRKLVPSSMWPGNSILENGDVYFSGDACVLDGIFTAEYPRYKIIVEIDATTANSGLFANLRVDGVADVSANYWYARRYNSGATPTAVQTASQTRFELGGASSVITSTGAVVTEIDLLSPMAALRTKMLGHTMTYASANAVVDTSVSGFFTLNTLFDGIQLHPAAGTITGKAAVYALD